MCECVNIEVGTYDNQVDLIAPKWSHNKYICVDSCLAIEILFLWHHGIRTSGCCCGHNKLKSYINVFPESNVAMIKLGYTYEINKFNTICYHTKSINN